MLPRRLPIVDDTASFDPSATTFTVATTRLAPGLVVLRVAGELDLATAPRLGTVLDGAIAATATADGAPRVVCDLDEVTFLGAAGLRTLHDAGPAAADLGVVPTVVATRTAVLRPLRITGLDRPMSVRTTTPAAARARAAGRSFADVPSG